MPDRKQVIFDIERCICHVPDACRDCSHYQKGEAAIDCMEILLADALALLREQEPRELTKNDWQMWKKDQRRNPICMVFEGDTTPFWVLYPEEVNELLYFIGKIKLFTNKPEKGTVKWDA